MGRDTRFIVTNLMGPRGKHLYEKLYSARGLLHQALGHCLDPGIFRLQNCDHGPQFGGIVRQISTCS